jgi:hypothetical protein
MAWRFLSFTGNDEKQIGFAHWGNATSTDLSLLFKALTARNLAWPGGA